ncbi:MAG: YbhB/YbcL family Raf kinase inhibitor-like protein [Planctomycetota bacterium]
MAMNFSSSTFKAQEFIPQKYTGDGPNLSPPLSWSDPPADVRSFALICDDPDAPMGTWVHWVIWNISADVRSLPDGVPTTRTLESGAVQGKNDFGKLGYGGPAPPRGKPHRYFFKLYALDATLNLPPGASKRDLEKAMSGHVRASAELVGLYRR